MPIAGDTQNGTLAQKLGGFFCGDSFATLPAATATRMTPYVLDTLVAALGGTTAASSRTIVRALLGQGGGTATVFGTGSKASPADAALVNGAASHALELDDDHRVSVMHPGAVVVPAAFALAEAEGVSGLAFLKGVLAGYEVAIRVGEAYQGTLYENGFHPTAVCGVFGSAAAGAVILGLDPAGFTRAMGIAGTQAAGLTEWRTDGSWIKRLHPGKSAQSGVVAALLAREGFTGPATVFEGDFGVFAALSHRRGVDAGALTRELGNDFRAFGTAIKPYPCCRFAHGAIDLALAVHAEMAGRAVDSITVRLFRTNVLTYHNVPTNTVDAQFNIPYLVATALKTGRVGLGDFTPEAVGRPDILDLARRITVIEDDGYSARYPHQYFTDVELRFADGTEHRGHSECPSGDPEAPAYQTDPELFYRETVAKARSVLDECGFGARADALIDRVEALETASDIHGIGALLMPPPP